MPPAIKSEKDLERYLLEAARLHQSGCYQQAIDIYLALAELQPKAAFLHYNIAHALSELGRYEDAIKHYQTALRYLPDDEDAIFNLACCQKSGGQPQAAIDSYQRLLALNPDHLDAGYNLGNCHKDLEQNEQAMACYLKVLELDEQHLSAANNLAFICHKLGMEREAIFYYRKVLQIDSGNVGAKYMLAALSGQGAAIAPPDYVQGVFDNYSSHYESSLVDKLEYRVPQKIMAAFAEQFPAVVSLPHFLDLGCGSGLGAAEFRHLCGQITGVDLSPKMLELAEQKGIYHELYCGDILEFLTGCGKMYNFILAADVFTYMGDLSSVFSAVFSSCVSDGIFAFSIETGENNFTLQKTGRFAHSPSYIKSELTKNGWRVPHFFQTRLRREKGQWTYGMIYFAVK